MFGPPPCGMKAINRRDSCGKKKREYSTFLILMARSVDRTSCVSTRSWSHVGIQNGTSCPNRFKMKARNVVICGCDDKNHGNVIRGVADPPRSSTQIGPTFGSRV